MSDCISIYPLFNPETFKETFTFSPYKLHYTDEDKKKCPLKLESEDVNSNQYYIDDPQGVWMHENYGFEVERRIIIKNPTALFGNSTYAIACSDSTLGLALQWSSKTSSQKFTEKIGTFTRNDSNKEILLSTKFKRCFFRGEVNLSIILYLESPGIPRSGEELYINQPGYMLGELETIRIQIDGNGSILPVYYEDVLGGVLWRVECNFDRPESADFSDPNNVSIIINRKNPNFKFINKKDEAYNQQMANEVMASAISMIIESVRVDDPQFSTLTDAETGSVSDALRYFREKLDWDFTSPISVNNSIRKAFEGRK